MGVAPSPTAKCSFDIVHRLKLDDELLKRICDALQIPEAERGRVVSAQLIISGAPASAGGGPQSTSGPAGPARERKCPAGAFPPTPSAIGVGVRMSEWWTASEDRMGKVVTMSDRIVVIPGR